MEVLAHESACGMPVSVQIDRLERALVDRGTEGFSVVSVDLYGLQGAERDAAVDAMAAGAPSPFVLVNGQLVCTGSVEVPAVLAALV